MRRIGLLLVLALVFSFNAPISSAAPKVGAKCSKAGKEAVNRGIELVCLAKGKRLIWTQKKLALGASTADEIVRDYLFALRENIKPNTSSINLNLSPRVPIPLGEKMREFGELASAYFQRFMVLDRKIELLVASPNEEEWVRNRVIDLPNQVQQGWLLFYTSRLGGAMAGITDQGLAYIFFKVNVINYISLESRADFLDTMEQTMYHEMVHIFQHLHSGETALKTCTPCWYGEGQAEVLSHSHFGSNKRNVDRSYRTNRYYGLEEVRSYLSTNGGLNKASIEAMVAKSLKRDEACAKSAAALAYNLGRLINEKLVIDFGLRKSIELMTRIGTDNWESIFLDIFGISQDEWLKKSGTPYVVKILNSPQSYLTKVEEKQMTTSIQFNGEPFPPPAKLDNYHSCLENNSSQNNSSVENSQSKDGELSISRADNIGDSATTGVITIVGVGIKSVRIFAYSVPADDLHFDSGILNLSGSPIVVPVTGLKCGTTYRTKISVFSETGGGGKEFVDENKGQLRTSDC